MMTKRSKLKWGLVGCGDISRRRVAPALRDLDTCQLTAVNRANPDQLESFAREFGADKIYSHWQDLVTDPDIEAVYIATPVNMHAEMTIKATQDGKHVLCEKPMAMTDSECGNMIDACQKNNVKLGVAYYRHHYPVIQRAKAIIDQGLIGDVMIFQMNAFSQFDRQPGEPRYWLLEKEKSGGGPMMDFG
ncbi:Gfo/Idh/MocA family protein, partial [bacterium]